MTNNLIPLLLKSKIDFFAKHLVASEFKRPPYDDLKFWNQSQKPAFSVTNGVWQSKALGKYESGGVEHTFDTIGNISFDYKVSTEYSNSFLVFLFNWTVIFAVSGEKEWKHYEYNFTKPLKNVKIYILYYRRKDIPGKNEVVWFKNLRINEKPQLDPSKSGWSLLHQFGAGDGIVAYPSIKTIKGKIESIDSGSKLRAAGISYRDDYVNRINYKVSGYILFYVWKASSGYIEIPLPDGYDMFMVELANPSWSEIYLYVGGKKVKTIEKIQGFTTYIGRYQQGDTFKIIIPKYSAIQIRSIWVKKER